MRSGWLRGVKVRLLAATVVAGFVTLSAGCSTRFFYDRIDTYIVWQVGSYVSLDKSQKADLKKRVSDYLDVVRLDELPRAAELLTSISADLNSGPVTPQMIDVRFHEMLALSEEIMVGLVPDADWLLRTLSEDQVQELADSLQELNDEMYEEYSGRTEQERRERRNKSSVSAIERFTGRLSDSQKELVTGALQQMTDSSEQWIAYQREWQRQFIELIASPPQDPEFRDQLTVLMVYPRSLHAPEYRAAVEANRAIFNVMMAELLNGLSDRQRSRMTETLNGYTETLLRLSANSEA